MRARYTAHVVGQIDFIVETFDPASRDTVDRTRIEQSATETEWKGLMVLDVESGGPDDTTGIVEFAARYNTPSGVRVLHERSSFRRVAGNWHYVSGQPGRPPGRNARCLCGSGKKVKQCCGARR